MAKTDFKTVDEYIGTFPKAVQDILEQIRTTIQKAVPAAEEVISYQIPAYKFHGWVLYFSAHKHHYSLSCPPPFTVFDVFKRELSPYEVSKSAIRFPMDKPVPVDLISEIATYRARENMERDKKKG
jgi:uncharacterized protein YdhG (YjbR/CyaY superfamily)